MSGLQVKTRCLRILKGVWAPTLSGRSSVLDRLTTIPPQLQLLGELFWHFLGQERAWVNDSFHSRRDLALMEFTCLAFQIQSHEWNARHRKAEREKSKVAKQWRMTRTAKLFCLYPALRHQFPENKRREEKDSPTAHWSFRLWNNVKLSNNLNTFATSICRVH